MKLIEQTRVFSPVLLDCISNGRLQASVLRLDLLHPVVSGNKWFKLKEHLAFAQKNKLEPIITFGGAFSNHIVATAAACWQLGLPSLGIIRGEISETTSHTLLQAAELGMELVYVSREDYKKKTIPANILQQYPNAWVIPEGGYGHLGMLGAKQILKEDTQRFTHIIGAVGTGTTLAGLIEAAEEHQQVIGISVLKNNFSLQDEINNLLSASHKNKFQLLHDFSLGGYAKIKKEPIDFMNSWYEQTGIPSDFVYTAKLFFAFSELCKRDFFLPGSNILLIHSGGLQGNLSLPKGTLIF